MPGRKAASQGASSYSGLTPLGIIATFVALSETVAGLAAVKTEGTVQIIFGGFAVLFPFFVAGTFFLILWKRAYVLYPPKAFGAEVDVRHYVDAMRHQALGNQELHSLLRTAIAETLRSQEAHTVIAQVSTERAIRSEEVLKEASAVLVEQAVDRLQSSVLTIDISAFRRAATSELVFPYDPTEEAFSLLSAVYFQIDDYVPPYTYGQKWVLRETKSGELMLPAGINWTDNYALSSSGATVRELGLSPGMRLRAIPIDHIMEPTGKNSN